MMIRKLLIKSPLLLLLSLMLSSPKIWAQEQEHLPATLGELTCLTTPEKIEIAICFKENKNCHEKVEALNQATAPNPKTILLWSAAAFFFGMVAEHRLAP
jgi:hypothetical protein